MTGMWCSVVAHPWLFLVANRRGANVFSPAEWVIAFGIGVGFWAFLWIGRRWIETRPAFQTGTHSDREGGFTGWDFARLVLSVVVVGALAQLQQRVTDMDVVAVLAIGPAIVVLPVLVAVTELRGSGALKVVRGAWTVLGLILVLLALFLAFGKV